MRRNWATSTSGLLEGWWTNSLRTLRSGRANPSFSRRFFPDAANAAQLALHRGQRLAQPGGDLLVGQPLHLGDGDDAQAVVAQGVEERSARLGHLGGKGRVGLARRQLGEVGAGVAPL